MLSGADLIYIWDMQAVSMVLVFVRLFGLHLECRHLHSTVQSTILESK